MLVKTLKKKADGILSTDSTLQEEILPCERKVIHTKPIPKTYYIHICKCILCNYITHMYI